MSLRFIRRVRRSASLPWRAIAWTAAALTLGVPSAAGADEAARADEYQVKAAFIYNFTKFIEWPRESSGASDEPFVIALIGRETMRHDLQQAVRGRKINGRAVVVKVVETAANAAGAQVLFFNGPRPNLEACRGKQGILLVGESDEFLARGGMIAFLFEDDKLRFAINIEAAHSAGLKVSAQLQKLAVNTKTKP